MLKELGRGAQGVVFLAEDKTLHRKVALKLLSGSGMDSEIVRNRFRREGQLTSRFEHPGICGVHDAGEVDGVPYIAMQYVRGTTLAALVEQAQKGAAAGPDEHGRSSDTITIVGGDSKGGLEDVLRLVERAARALHVAHEAGLVHRDIKPANIMVTQDGHPVLLDFGLARDLGVEGQTLTQSGQIMGTPAYLAPEQIVPARGAVDRRTDVYALGVTLYECLTLRRPFESTTWDQLFHEILDGAQSNPGKLNPRIPKDLRTVVEVAMDRDPARRYPTAEALAEDLRRVRSFEPIQAKADGTFTRMRKWSRRNPGRAASAAAVALFVLVALGSIGWRLIERSRALQAHLRDANQALVSADYVAAAVAVAKAQDLDPESPEVRELTARVERGRAEAQRRLDRETALHGAETARAESEALRGEYERTRTRIRTLAARLLKDQSGVLAHYADDATRAQLARGERELRALRIEAERILLARSEALERASRLEDPWGGASAATQGALSGFYLERWREALEARDPVLATAMRTAVERHDPQGEHTAELLGRGRLSVVVTPAEAELFLFRFEEYDSVREGDVIPRLVPVPTSGVGRAHDGPLGADFHPGDPCLVVRTVAPDSIAARHGLQAGDLVVRFQSAPAAQVVYATAIERASPLDGLQPPTRILDIDGFPIRNRFDCVTRLSRREGPPPRVRFEGLPDPVECALAGLGFATASELIAAGVPHDVTLGCLRGGEWITLQLPAGTRSGLTCDTTAYALVLAASNRIDTTPERTVDPGSYLVFARSPGFEPQRYHLVVERGADVTARLDLLPTGTTPDEFVYVPPGAFTSGGDPDAFRPREARRVEVPGFFVARRELTNREWYAFVNDPMTLAQIAATQPGEHLYLPQDDRVMAKPGAIEGTYTFDVYFGTTDESPVLGLTWTDARDYLAWRNARAERDGEPWRYDLPSALEWEKAARGVDARLFPWGNRFDPSLTVCLARQDGYLLDAPGGYEPRDESPFGVLDLAGSREEWLRDAVADVEPPRYLKRGGHWGSAVEVVFHSASHGEASQDRFAGSQGLRLVARRVTSQ
ncbi:MAG: SUMF1/EgtB/PvdO family nonheme iron enzyme [Planctomycetes bacterium]|nr:SUMF1/EgtB/PvdO family nonheme iron enzyme [Planctomycetota bacterium]